MNNLDLMRKRLEFQGGIKQEDRMIKDKYKTFLKTLLYSYQGCDVRLTQPYTECPLVETENDEVQYETFRALINPDKVKQDYDDKILSIDYNKNFIPGNVFLWAGTNTQWIIYLEQLTEDAYFRGEIRRCRWKIKFKDNDGNYRYTWAAIRGPIETQIDSIQKNQKRIDNPNWSLNILIPYNDYTKEIFTRYSRFLLDGMAWEVKVVNRISMTNVLEISAEEYYIDKNTDDLEQQVANGLYFEPIDPNDISTMKMRSGDSLAIVGETFIIPMTKNTYTAPEIGGTWSIRESFPVTINNIDDCNVEIVWQKPVSGQFTLLWQKDDTILQKIVVVQSLF